MPTKATTSSAENAILCIAETKGRFGFCWSVADNEEEAAATCKKDGGDMRTAKIKVVPRGSWLDDMGCLHYPMPPKDLEAQA